MKTTILGFILSVISVLGSIFLPACAGYKAAVQAYDASIDDANKAAENIKVITMEVQDIYDDLQRIKTEYELAIKNDDKPKAEALLRAGQDALTLLSSKKEMLKQAQVIFEQAKDFVGKAKKRAEDAKSSEEYIGNVFGTIAAAICGIFGVGGLGAAAVQGRRAAAERKDYEILASAAKKTSVNVDTYVPDDKWAEFLKAQNASMTREEIAELDYARKGTA